MSTLSDDAAPFWTWLRETVQFSGNVILNAVKDLCVMPGFFALLRMTAPQD